MITASKENQLRLSENGEITWQKDPTNPLPGEKIGIIVKGESVTAPLAVLDDTPLTQEGGLDANKEYVQNWLNAHIKTGLEPMFKLLEDDVTAEPAKQIAQKVFDRLGILPREEVQEHIDQMDEEARQSLRTKKLRFGPLLVYLPELKKPAAVRLQAILLTLWNDKPLPATVPSDGIVSFSLEGKDFEKDYLLAIGYPVYGPRAMRVDMLDRVVCAIYDNAKEGKFQAQHQMAEWLGSNIADLYAVIEAMGHKKIYDPADHVAPEGDDKPEDEAAVEAVTEDKPAEKKEQAPKDTNQSKPELATFALKRGKASGNASAPKKNFKNADKKSFKDSNKKKPFKKKPKSEPRERVYVAEAKVNPEDSPFAALAQLKVSNKKD